MAYYVDVRGLSENQLKGLEAVLKAGGYAQCDGNDYPDKTLAIYGVLFGEPLSDSAKRIQYLEGVNSDWSVRDNDTAATPQQLLEKLAPPWATGLGSTPYYNYFWWYDDDNTFQYLPTGSFGWGEVSLKILKANSLFTFNKPKRLVSNFSGETIHVSVGGSTLGQLDTLLHETGTCMTVDNSEGERKITLEINEECYQVESLEKAVAALEKYKAFLDSVEGM